MKFKLLTQPKGDFLAVSVFEGEKTDYPSNLVKNFLRENPKFGKRYEFQSLYSDKEKILLLGAGKKDKFDFELLQNLAGTAVKSLATKTKTLSLILPQLNRIEEVKISQAAVLGAEIALHDPSKEYRSELEKVKLENVELVVKKVTPELELGLKQGLVLSEGVNLARRLADLPANEMTPSFFLEEAKKAARENKLKCSFLNEDQAKKKGMGAFVGVAQGSEEPSFMIALEYSGSQSGKEKWGLVGKGITFDSGGMSLKPAQAMVEMKYDCCGAAAVLGILVVLAKLKVKANVVGIMAVTENLIGGKAQRPGDIVKTYSGKTVEVLNTDAEGRLVVADGLTFAQKDFKATKLIDLATLTGAMIVALGDLYTGAFGNNPKFTQDVIVAGAKVGEKIWEMPMDEDYEEMLKSDFADINNTGRGGSMADRTAMPVMGAKLIEAMVEANRPWVHLDIAGPAWDLKPKPYRSVGATGVGVKTVVELISHA